MERQRREKRWDKTEIYMYAMLGLIGHALKVFDEILDHERKVANWNAMISRYWKWESEDQAQWPLLMML